MNVDLLAAIGGEAMTVAILIALPILALALVAGVAVSLLQAVTQIQEVTLTFVPKMIAVAVAIAVFGPWMAQRLLAFTANLLMSLPTLIR